MDKSQMVLIKTGSYGVADTVNTVPTPRWIYKKIKIEDGKYFLINILNIVDNTIFPNGPLPGDHHCSGQLNVCLDPSSTNYWYIESSGDRWKGYLYCCYIRK
jgi:hypothetical protein